MKDNHDEKYGGIIVMKLEYFEDSKKGNCKDVKLQQ
jgi:hypothetical protein